MKTTRLGTLLAGTIACGLAAGCGASTGGGGDDPDPPVAGDGGTGNVGGGTGGKADASASSGGQGGSNGQAGASGQAGAGGRAGASGQAGSTGGAGAGGGAAGQGNGGGSGSGRRDGGVTGVDAAPVGNGRDAAPVGGADAAASGEKFSFFYTSLEAMQKLSGSEKGFGGDLRYGEATGLQGADKICQEIAASASPGAGAKTWRAFLSVTKGPDGRQVDAIDRIGAGPWYDRRGRLIAMNVAGLLAARPTGDKGAADDLPDESGLSTRRYDGKNTGDTHDALTGSNDKGRLLKPGDLTSTCNDWTNSSIKAEVMAGHSWPAGSGRGWIEAHTVHSCAPGVNININNGMGDRSSVGAGGGWGGFYCFATTP